MLQPYIESATALSDVDNKELQEFPVFCRSAEMDLHHLTVSTPTF